MLFLYFLTFENITDMKLRVAKKIAKHNGKGELQYHAEQIAKAGFAVKRAERRAEKAKAKKA